MTSQLKGSKSTPERLAYWYLRLNGFFLLENFVIHPDTGSNQRTDADLIGIRLANRSEYVGRTLQDDPRVCRCATTLSIVIAEVKTGLCALNGPWTRPEDANIYRVLRAIGCFSQSAIELAANQLYKGGKFCTSDCTCRLLAFGDGIATLPIKDVEQILFDQMIGFIHGRFKEFARQKSSVGNWAEDGQFLARAASSKLPDFRQMVREKFGLHAIPTKG